MASDGALYIHNEPLNYVYVHACIFWHRTENFEHLPCGPSRVFEPQWRGQMDQILLPHSWFTIQTGNERNKEPERQSTTQRDLIIEMEKTKNTPLKRNLAASKLRR